MELARHCRLNALQCFRWAAEIEDSTQHLAFTKIAREWLSVAEAIERSPSNAHEIIRARLH